MNNFLIQRRNFLITCLLSLALFFCGLRAFAQVTCSVSASNTFVRSQGLTEPEGTILLSSCSGSIPAGGAILTVTMQPASALITNSTSPGFIATAVVSTTAGGVTTPVVVTATVSGSTASFAIPPTPVGATLTSIQIGVAPGIASTVPVRVNAFASGVTFPSQISALLTSSPSGVLALNQSLINVASPSPGLFATFASGASIFQGSPAALSGVPSTASFVSGAVPSFTAVDSLTLQSVSASSVPVVSIAESFASALLVAGAPPAGNGEGADTSGIGTRVLIRILNLSANIAIYAPQQISTNTPGGTLTLTLVTGADSNGAGGSVLAVPSPATSSLISGASITYETTANNASLIERADIPLGLFTTGTPTAGTMTINVFLAPVSALGSAAPTGAAPIPRFSEVAAQSQVPPGQPAILLSASNFDLSVPVGTRPSPQTLAVTNSGGGILNWTAAINSITGGNWLTLSPTSGTEDTNVLVSLNSAALAVGTYSAKVLVSAPGASNSPQTLTVTLNVTSTSLLLTPSSISFNSLAGSNPAPQRFSILTGGGVLNWNATVNSPGGNWLTISPSSGVTPATITATANSAGLNPGSYQGLITVSAPGASTAQAVTVTFVLGAPTPVVAPNGIVNGASFSKEAVVSPGSISTLFGSNLAATTAAATTTPLPLTLAATQVLVNESSAPLFYVSPTQINFQMPTGLLGSTAQIVVVSNGVRSLAASVNVLPAAPGIFTAIPGGTGQGAVLNQDSSLNSEQNPATVGTVLQIFTTGLGATVPPVLAGQPQTGTPPPETAITPTVLIAGIPAEITYSGLAPNFVGLYQVNVRVPAGISSGSAVPLQMLVSGGGASEAVSNMVTVAIR